ncbi:MAG: GNAT family N-acetyltransferase [Pontiellaceae bacterium]|nr:GNAT family N-acetyltransferase [Pontiellaceae bacterium]
MNTDYTIRTLRRDEMDLLVEWAAQEGWNPGLHDADVYFAADNSGFLIGLLDGQPIAAISAVKYTDAFGFIGFYIVKPEYRGQGYGIKIWNAALDYLEGAVVGLDGVVDQQANYKKSGFTLAYRNIRYEGTGGGTPPHNDEIVKLSDLPFELVNQYDQPFFPADRTHFTQCWTQQPGAHALGIMNDDKLAGYGVIRKCRNGYKMGPLFADTPELAETLFLTLKARATSSDLIYLDVPEVNPAAVALAEKQGMSVAFETARMYKGTAPNLPLSRLYGVASFEIG